MQRCFNILEIPPTTDSSSIRRAYLKLVKKYHPDTGARNGNKNKFCDLHDAFKALSKEIAKNGSAHHKIFGKNQHLGFQEPYMKKLFEDRNVVQEESLGYFKRRSLRIKEHDFKSKDELKKLIQDKVKGFEQKVNLKTAPEHGTSVSRQSYDIDCPRNQLNEILANNGYSPTLISLQKCIANEIENLSRDMSYKRATLGPVPLTSYEQQAWEKLIAEYEPKVVDLRNKISIYNLILPLANKPMLIFNFSNICSEILHNGNFKRPISLIMKNDTEPQIDKLEICVKYFTSIFIKIKELYRRRWQSIK